MCTSIDICVMCMHTLVLTEARVRLQGSSSVTLYLLVFHWNWSSVAQLDWGRSCTPSVSLESWGLSPDVHARCHLATGTSVEKMPTSAWPVGISWLMIMWESPAHPGQCHLWAGGPGQHKNTGWTKHKNLEGKHFVGWAVSLVLALYTHQLETRIVCHVLWIIHSSFHYQHVSSVSWESLVSKR